jgi:Domain of unknown function DUF29
MTQNAVFYEEDYYAWTIEQTRLLRAGEWSALDAANLAEEIESRAAASGASSETGSSR